MDLMMRRRALMVQKPEDPYRDYLADVEWTEGYYIATGGNIVANSLGRISNYVRVKPNTTYTLTGCANAGSPLYDRVHSYNSEKTWTQMIERFDWLSSDFTSTFTTPAQCKYIRVSTEITTDVSMYGKFNTLPRIAEYGVYWSRTYGEKTAQDGWCITEVYEPSPTYDSLTLYGYVGTDASYRTFQFEGALPNGNIRQNFFYFAGQSYRTAGLSGGAVVERITFSLDVAELDNVYVYVGETGQVLFAGKNTPYYGYANINDMPTGT